MEVHTQAGPWVLAILMAEFLKRNILRALNFCYKCVFSKLEGNFQWHSLVFDWL